MNKIFVVVDVETNGPIVSQDEMTSFGAVVVDKNLNKTFYARLECKKIGYLESVNTTAPIETRYEAMERFENWLNSHKTKESDTIVFISDNPCFDWQFINYYFLTTIKRNPFGFSGRRIGDIWSGLTKNINDQSEWRKLVKTPHDHNPTNDAIGHAEALVEIIKRMDNQNQNQNQNLNLNNNKNKNNNNFNIKNKDWNCPNCNVMIFGSKSACMKCGCKNPNMLNNVKNLYH